MFVPGLLASVPGTRNAGKPHQHMVVPGVPGVPGSCACVRVSRNAHARLHANKCIARTYISTRNTRNTRNKPVKTRLLAVPGTRNTTQTTRNSAMSRSLRTEMPETAAFIDAMRAAFGAEMINQTIKAGLNGQPTFWASENGREIGAKAEISAEKMVSGADLCIWNKSPQKGPQNAKRGNQ